LLIIAESAVKDVTQLIELLASRRITRIVLVPSLLRAMLAAESGLGSRLEKLRIVVTSGEASAGGPGNLFRSAMPHAKLLNFYVHPKWRPMPHGPLSPGGRLLIRIDRLAHG